MTALEPLLLLHPSDNVAVARRALQAGEILTVAGRTLEILDAVP
ncbi:MAG: altronate hydrolase, partial [Planctomycetota bacterium]